MYFHEALTFVRFSLANPGVSVSSGYPRLIFTPVPASCSQMFSGNHASKQDSTIDMQSSTSDVGSFEPAKSQIHEAVNLPSLVAIKACIGPSGLP